MHAKPYVSISTTDQLITKKRICILLYIGQEIEKRAQCTKLFKTTIEEALNWEVHIKYVLGEVSKSVFAIK